MERKPAAKKRAQPNPAAPVKRAPKKRADVVDDLLAKVEETLGQEGVKTTVGDYIRLVQLQKELKEDEPRNIEVRWVDTQKTDPDPET
jgi:hypothetical protein